MSNTEHMNFLEVVAAEDVAHLRMKEKTYGSSWKKRGGVGAFMMLARKWDRIDNILPTAYVKSRAGADNIAVVPYDIFAHIAADPEGEDSSILAEVRDLRRYLMLVEAEMMARGVVAAPKVAEVGPQMAPTLGDLYGELAKHWGIPRKEAKDRVYSLCYSKEVTTPGTPDDGGHHAKYPPDALRDGESMTYNESVPHIEVVEPHTFQKFYDVDRRQVDPDLWAHLPRVPERLKVITDIRPEYRGLYQWWENEKHWIMAPEFRKCWGIK